MESAGFKYIDNTDRVHCYECKLEVTGWTSDMEPFTIHSERSPSCPFVLSMRSSHKQIPYTTSNPSSILSISSNQQQSPQTDNNHTNNQSITFQEVDILKQARKRTLSHYPHRSSPSFISQMTDAGFFSCNVADRVICIYCNLICQQWIPTSDDPSHIHRILSPKCPYVIGMLTRPQTSSILVINEQSTNNQSLTSNNNDAFRHDAVVCTAASNPSYIEIPKRYASFATWSNDNSPSVDDLVKSGFFYTGTKTIVTCFYCNGSLQNWGPNDNPTNEHARWFPHCAYAKQLCGSKLYENIQESKRIHQEKTTVNSSSNGSVEKNTPSIGNQLSIPDESTLSRLVAARIDLPISISLLKGNFKASIVKRCWEDQLRLKRDDFVSDYDLWISCTILQKQIEGINGKKENIIVPSVTMRKLREKEEAEAQAQKELMSSSSLEKSSSPKDIDMATPLLKRNKDDTKTPVLNFTANTNSMKLTSTAASEENSNDTTSPSNPCVLCLTEEKQLACLPCGHLIACVPCAHSLRSCPICRSRIDAFMRIYT
ncbi:unnamed protein product [Adineta steineri]|uniref:RING-type domain-containing protein n=3 Tax=Adineta steineri TaxID=433720 RepID=A0A814A7K2_9BILA|nr:unnamed protein product [Adineta steineri]